MKTKKSFSLVLFLMLFAVVSFAQKINSQFTKTWFADGHIEAMIVYTDGTHYTYPTEWLDGNAQSHRLPHAGDFKHCEWVWRNNQWISTVTQKY
ncbi:MAG: hypothetical protein ACXVAY_01105 [Mucilaginibacter sp.]